MKLTAELLKEKGFVELASGNWAKGGIGGNLEIIKAEIVAKPPRRIRQSSKPRLNKLETEFLGILKERFYPATCSIRNQAMRFELANGLWYKPDFVVFFPHEERLPCCFEVKGPKSWRGGFENLKMAARAWPMFVWTLVWKIGPGEWKEQTVLP